MRHALLFWLSQNQLLPHALPLPEMTLAPAVPRVNTRLPLLDATRGLAIIAMFTYHLVWDLGFFRLIDPGFPATPGFRLYGNVIASSFLALVGVSLVLALHRPNPWPGFFRRLAMVCAGAGAVTLATLWIFPDSFIFFGILHCIALSSVLALPLLRAPLWATILAAMLAGAAPHWVAQPLFDQPAFWWLGLGTYLPASNDYRPLLPWFGAVLLGVAAARLALAMPIAPLHLRHSRIVLRLAWAGRHSFLIYMAHQPILFALVWGAAQIAATPQASDETGFQVQCEIQCAAGETNAPVCARACACLVGELKGNDLWRDVAAGNLPGATRQRFGELAAMCRVRAEQ